jgi:hypothetical protein
MHILKTFWLPFNWRNTYKYLKMILKWFSLFCVNRLWSAGNWRPARVERDFGFPLTLPPLPRPDIFDYVFSVACTNDKCVMIDTQRCVTAFILFDVRQSRWNGRSLETRDAHTFHSQKHYISTTHSLCEHQFVFVTRTININSTIYNLCVTLRYEKII